MPRDVPNNLLAAWALSRDFVYLVMIGPATVPRLQRHAGAADQWIGDLPSCLVWIAARELALVLASRRSRSFVRHTHRRRNPIRPVRFGSWWRLRRAAIPISWHDSSQMRSSRCS